MGTQRYHSLKKLLFKCYLKIPGNKIVFKTIRAVGIPSYKIRRNLRFSGIFELQISNDKRIRLKNYGNTIENELFWNGINGWEPTSLKVWMELSSTANVILDIGANNGLYSVIAGAVNQSATIHAFEPMPTIFGRLLHNIELNGLYVHTHQFALSSEDGEATIYSADTISDTLDQASLNKRHYKTSNVVEHKIIKRKLSSVIETHAIARVDLIKIDVESFEPFVLLGMGNYLSAFKPAILLEILDDQIGSAVMSIIEDLNYTMYRVEERVGLRLVNSLKPLARGNNFILIQEGFQIKSVNIITT